MKKSPNTVYRYINSLQNLLRSKVKTFTIPGKDSHNTLSDHVAVSPVTTLCDSHIISPYNITPESHIKVARIKEMITMQLKLLIVKTNSPYQQLEKFIENSMKKMHNGVWV